MPKFNINQQRKPWNNTAKWLYDECKYIATAADSLGIESVDQFIEWLKLSAKDQKLDISRVNISCWNVGLGKRVAGINKMNSTYGPALYITMTTNDKPDDSILNHPKTEV